MDKIKISTGRDGEYMDLPMNCTRLFLPNGDEYSIRYDHVNKGLEIIKAYSDNESNIIIIPGVSNKILIK